MAKYTQIILGYYGVMNILLLLFMFSDKRKAVKHLYRIKEMTLFKMALLGGAIGGFLGMFLFRHKSRKVKFYVIYSLALVAHAGLLYFIFVINK